MFTINNYSYVGKRVNYINSNHAHAFIANVPFMHPHI